MDKDRKHQRGFGAVEIVMVITIIALIGFVCWRVWETYLGNSSASKSNRPSSTNGKNAALNAPSNLVAPALQKVSILSGALQLEIPAGWAKLSENQLSKIIEGQEFIIQIQQTETDYLASGNYASDISILKTTQTAGEHPVYIIRTSNYAAVNKCAPSSNQACSFTLGGQPLFMLLTSHKPSDTFPGTLDFTASSTTQAVDDFTMMAKSLKL